MRKSNVENRQNLFNKLKKAPNDHALLSRIGRSYYSEKNYKRAYHFERDALLIEPKNAIYICNFACVLDMIGNYEQAIVLFREILNWSILKIQKKTNLDTLGALSFKNDCRFRISITYYKTYNDKLARRYLSLYEKIKTEKKLATIYSKKDLTEHKNDLKSK